MKKNYAINCFIREIVVYLFIIKNGENMKIIKKFIEKKVLLSYEIFPPKITSPIETIYDTLKELQNISPDYISITYGAGGSEKNNRTIELANIVKNELKIEPLAHLTCIHSNKQNIDRILQELQKNNIKNILALRGDRREGFEISKDFVFASDLIRYIRDNYDFDITGACYPEGHFECDSIEKDLENLKIKVDAGVSHLNSQLFFDNNDFYEFVNKARQKGINVPIQAGIMPITSKKQIEKMVSLGGIKLPSKLSKLVACYGDNKEAMRDAGIAYATDQIINLLTNDVQGIHLYIMNNAYIAKQITSNIISIINGINNEN